jgi:16S rRNA (cytosine1402-N4)-methyltransferase
MHQPVLRAEVLDWLVCQSGGVYADGTVGDGGHAEGILLKSGPDSRLLLIDRDAEALERVRRRLARWRANCWLAHGNFADLPELAQAHGFGSFDGIFFDLGVSSAQLDAPERGFSLQADGPLDMRMDRTQRLTAAILVNTLPETKLADLIWRYGEEPAARRIARAIAEARRQEPLATTARLAAVVARAKGGFRKRWHHPATLTFQALRLAVNEELESLERGLAGAANCLHAGGRLAVIAFHSLEDRIVKHFFLRHSGRWESRPQGGRTWRVTLPEMTILTKKPIGPTPTECRLNPRARSAKLRVAERSA